MIRSAGDAAVTLALGSRLDAVLNTRVHATAAALVHAAVPGVRDVVPAMASVTAHFDPVVTSGAVVAEVLASAAAGAQADLPASRLVDVPVVYGGVDGPDLAAVAAHAGLSADEVIRRHAAETYRVFMLGFSPGFPYLGIVDPSIATPRHATPRLRVPAGSVGIADQQTGIYPRSEPGGWQLLGRTGLSLFDAGRAEPARLRPGDLVRFVPVGSLEPLGDVEPELPPVSGASLTVLRPGWYTTVQDLGRWGWQQAGVPVSGAMDTLSHRAANRLVGNPDGAATLEMTVVGPEVRFEQATLVAVCGADLAAVLDGRPLATATAVRAAAGSVLQFSGRLGGTRAYLACAGGFDVPPVLGSRATHVASRLGGWAGRPLHAGDRLPLGEPIGRPDGPLHDVPHTAPEREAVTLRVVPGPHADSCDPGILEQLTARPHQVSAQANRMGYRLDGGIAAEGRARAMVSEATVAGAVQITGTGAPILLAADRQTTGGYPQVAVVIAADLPRMGQLGPGDWIRLAPCTYAEAHTALMAQEAVFGRC